MKLSLPKIPKAGWIFLIGAGLRIIFLTTNPLWYDETFTLLISRLDLPHLITATAGDVHPPLYYIIINSLLALPLPSMLAMRGFSVICSIGAMFQLWGISGELGYQPRARLLALAIMAILPVEIYYAQEARMYALLQFLVLTQILLMLRRDWNNLAIVSILCLYTHNYGLIYTFIIYSLAIWRERALIHEESIVGPTVSAIASGVAFLPWLFMCTFRQMSNVAAGYWIQPITIGNIIYAILQITFTSIMPTWLIWIACPVLGMILLVGLISGWKHQRVELLTLAIAPLLLAVIISIIWKPMLLFRGLIGSIPALALILSEAAFERRAWFWSSLAASVIIISLGWMMYLNAQGSGKEKQHIVLSIPRGPGVMVHLNDNTLLPYLAERPELTHYLLDTGCEKSDPGSLSPITRQAMGIKTINPDELGIGYLFAALVGPLSTQCELKTFEALIDHAQPIAFDPLPIGENGVWYVNH